MNLNYNKQTIINLYKELIINTLDEFKLSKKKIAKIVKNKLSKLILTKKELKVIKNKVINELLEKKYKLNINETEKIISILSNTNKEIKIEYKFQDTEPAIYYSKENELYLINFDSIENKWYLSLLEKNSLKLIKEIYSDSYENFIKYLKN